MKTTSRLRQLQNFSARVVDAAPAMALNVSSWDLGVPDAEPSGG